VSNIPGVDDIVDDTSDPTQDDDTDPAIAAQTRKSLVVPGNVMPWVEDAADQFGVPRDLLAAVVYQHSRFSGLTPGIVAQVAARLADSYDQQSYTSHTLSGEGEQDPFEVWLDAAADFAYGGHDSASAQAYRAQLGRVYGGKKIVDEVRGGKKTGRVTVQSPTGITLGADIKLPAGKFTTARFPGGIGGGAAYGPGGSGGAAAAKPIIPGLSDDAATAVQRVADPIFLKYYGRFPTVDEYIDMSRKGFTQQQLEQHLRNQQNPNAPGTTVGQAFDMRDLANKWANSTLGRDASEGEVNFMLANKIPANDDHISAFFEQVRDHAVWQGDPVKWRAMRDRLQTQWNKLGLTGDVDPNTVNDALAGKWTDQQAADHFRAMPAPGYPAGTTVGEVDRLRTLASNAKSTYFPGEVVSDSELKALQGMTPDQILQHYRSIVPPNSKTGLPVGVESDYRAMAESVLSKYGVAGYDVTPADLKFFALTKADPAAILAHFAENPAIAAAHPGLAYGMNSEQYRSAVQGLRDAYGGVFPGEQLAEPRAGASKAERDNSLIGHALAEGISPGELGSVSEQFRQERGRAPTTTEFRERRNRPAQRPGGGGASAAITTPDPTTERGTPRPAVGGRA
jgi:hypothetical protein